MTVSFNSKSIWKVLHVIVLVAILGLVAWSQPWNSGKATKLSRTISVSGEATVDASPDELVFTPYFEQKGTDRNELRNDLTKQANEVVDKLKEIGVAEEKIKLDASSYDRWYWNKNEEGTMSVSIRVTVNDKDKAQEIQDYLLTLDNIKGQLTPQGNFSKGKQKELEAQATEGASKDARSKAEAQAALFGMKLGDVVKVEQGGGSGPFPVTYRAEALQLDEAASSLPVLLGEDEYTKSVQVVYELR